MTLEFPGHRWNSPDNVGIPRTTFLLRFVRGIPTPLYIFFDFFFFDRLLDYYRGVGIPRTKWSKKVVRGIPTPLYYSDYLSDNLIDHDLLSCKKVQFLAGSKKLERNSWKRAKN